MKLEEVLHDTNRSLLEFLYCQPPDITINQILMEFILIRIRIVFVVLGN